MFGTSHMGLGTVLYGLLLSLAIAQKLQPCYNETAYLKQVSFLRYDLIVKRRKLMVTRSGTVDAEKLTKS